MHIHGTNYAVVSLDLSEIETIISALEIEWQEWQIDKAGILLVQFQKLKKELIKQSTNITDDSK